MEDYDNSFNIGDLIGTDFGIGNSIGSHVHFHTHVYKIKRKIRFHKKYKIKKYKNIVLTIRR